MALLFNGTSDWMERLSAPVTAAPLSMGCFAFFNSHPSVEYVLMALADPDSLNEFWLGLYAQGGNLYVRGVSQNFPDALYKGPQTGGVQGGWHHFGVSFNAAGTDVKAYLDSVTANDLSQGFGPTVPAGISTTSIGALRYNTSLQYGFCDATICEGAIWNDVLDPEEWYALARGFSPLLVRPSKLVSYVDMIDADGRDLKGAPFTVTGTTDVEHFYTVRPRRRQVSRLTAAAGAGLKGPLIRGGSLGHGALIRGGRLAA